MEKGYDKEIDLYYKSITRHYHSEVSPCILPLGHENLQTFMLFAFHEKDAPTVSSTSHCSVIF